MTLTPGKRSVLLLLLWSREYGAAQDESGALPIPRILALLTIRLLLTRMDIAPGRIGAQARAGPLAASLAASLRHWLQDYVLVL
jgi:hypothetical protein